MRSMRGRVNSSLQERCRHFEDLSDSLQEQLDEEKQKRKALEKELGASILPPVVKKLKERKPRQPLPLQFMAVCLKHLLAIVS